MKKLFYSIIAVAFMFSCTQQPQYKIQGNIDGLNSGSAVLGKVVDNELVTVDSVAIENGSFSFKGTVEQPELYIITFADSLEGIQLFLENTNLNIKAHVDSISRAKVEGSELTSLLNSYNKEIIGFNIKMRNLYNEYMQANMSGNTERAREIEEEYANLEDEQMAYIKSFIKENSDAEVAPYITLRYLSGRLDAKELREITSNFTPEVLETKYAKTLTDRLELMERVAVGQPYVDFTLNDTSGNPVSLSSVVEENDYVLVDFWAAWCTPCRQENPNLVAEYAKYHDKGFEIFGVSFDKTREDWIKAIKDDGITWPQVSDLKYWDSAAGKLYVVRSIPHSVLIGKDGTIIAKNLRGEELGEKLSELMD